MQNDNHSSRKTLYAIIGIATAAVLVIITISVLGIVLSNRSSVNIINDQPASESTSSSSQSSEARSTTQLSDTDLTNVKRELAYLLKSTKSVEGDFDVAVRWDSLKTTSGSYPVTTFLVDVDAYQQTYLVTIAGSGAEISCPELGESKYPESFCIGSAGDYDDSIGIVFGSSLPYSGYTSAGEYFSIARGSKNQSAGIHTLDVLVSNCSLDPAAKDRANAAVDEVITSLGASPNLFERQISIIGCHGE